MMPETGEITLLQMDGFLQPDLLPEVFEKARRVLRVIEDLQRKALKEKYALVDLSTLSIEELEG